MQFKYLGSIFSADGEHMRDVDRRVGSAMNRCGQLRHIFNSKDLPLALKVKIYKVAVSSLITYVSEEWRLDERTCVRINGSNARCMQCITGKTVRARGIQSPNKNI